MQKKKEIIVASSEPNSRPLLKALKALTELRLVHSVRTRRMGKTVHVSVALNTPADDIGEKKMKEFLSQSVEYNRAFAEYKRERAASKDKSSNSKSHRNEAANDR